MKEIKRNKVWRTMSSTGHSGYFVWDVIEVIDEYVFRLTEKDIARFEPTKDGGYILIHCFHSWSKDRAIELLNSDDFSQYQEVTIVGMKNDRN